MSANRALRLQKIGAIATNLRRSHHRSLRYGIRIRENSQPYRFPSEKNRYHRIQTPSTGEETGIPPPESCHEENKHSPHACHSLCRNPPHAILDQQPLMPCAGCHLLRHGHRQGRHCRLRARNISRLEPGPRITRSDRASRDPGRHPDNHPHHPTPGIWTHLPHHDGSHRLPHDACRMDARDNPCRSSCNGPVIPAPRVELEEGRAGTRIHLRQLREATTSPNGSQTPVGHAPGELRWTPPSR